MTLASALCWLGVGLWLIADSARAPRLIADSARARRLAIRTLAPAGIRALRVAGGALVLGAGVPLAHELGVALGSVALLVLASALLSLAVLVYPLGPRWYAASLPVALALALATTVWG